jgi:hypothetical protein
MGPKGKKHGMRSNYSEDLIRACYWLYYREPRHNGYGLSATKTAAAINETGLVDSPIDFNKARYIASLYQPRVHGKLDANPLNKKEEA